jgi:invasion protein IalB
MCGAQANSAIAAMLKGHGGASRTTRWPSETVEFEFTLEGFPEAYKVFRELTKHPHDGN